MNDEEKMAEFIRLVMELVTAMHCEPQLENCPSVNFRSVRESDAFRQGFYAARDLPQMATLLEHLKKNGVTL